MIIILFDLSTLKKRKPEFSLLHSGENTVYAYRALKLCSRPTIDQKLYERRLSARLFHSLLLNSMPYITHTFWLMLQTNIFMHFKCFIHSSSHIDFAENFPLSYCQDKKVFSWLKWWECISKFISIHYSIIYKWIMWVSFFMIFWWNAWMGYSLSRRMLQLPIGIWFVVSHRPIWYGTMMTTTTTKNLCLH